MARSRRPGPTPRRAAILADLAALGPQTAGALAARYGLGEGAISRLLLALYDAGLLQRRLRVTPGRRRPWEYSIVEVDRCAQLPTQTT